MIFRILILFVLLTTFSRCKDPVEQSKRPNVIIIITDDQGYGDIGAHGNGIIKTPNLDKLHSESVRFTDFHVSPTCSPTRAALLTGHYTNRTGAWHTIAGRSQLRSDEVTMADVFSENDYETGIFGKWHLGDNYPFRPQDRGFSEVLVHGGGGVGQQPDYWSNDYFNDTYFHNGIAEKFDGYCTDIWFDNARKWISQKTKENSPFFAYISTNAPHWPFLVQNTFSETYKGDANVVNPEFYGMIENIDHNIGQLIDQLDQDNTLDNTILIFMSDNGTAAGATIDRETRHVTKGFNAGMRGRKNSPYEGGHRVPFFIRWPSGGIDQGVDIDQLTAHIDVLPTLIDLLEFESPEGLKFDGASLVDLLRGTNELKGRPIITDSQREEYPQKWKASAVMQDKWRLINGKELYDITRDPGQRENVATKYSEKVEELRNEYDKWWNDISPSFNDMPRTIIGSEFEKVTTLFVHDMHLDEEVNKILPWNQNQIRNSTIRSTGWWPIKVAEAATYEMKLSRWPTYINHPIREGVSSTEPESGTNFTGYGSGPDLPIKTAYLQVGDSVIQKPVEENVSQVLFDVRLDSSVYDIRAWFGDGEPVTMAVNYIEIMKKEE